jgi:hypothetical protein
MIDFTDYRNAIEFQRAWTIVQREAAEDLINLMEMAAGEEPSRLEDHRRRRRVERVGDVRELAEYLRLRDLTVLAGVCGVDDPHWWVRIYRAGKAVEGNTLNDTSLGALAALVVDLAREWERRYASEKDAACSR